MLGAGTLLTMGTARAAGCQLGTLAEVPVTMNGLRPTIVASINGTPTTFIVDSGAFYSSLSPAKAAELKLSLSPAPDNFHISGVGGSATAYVTLVKELTIFNRKLSRREFIVGGSEPGNGISGIIGQNFLSLGDVEYDLANGVIRIMVPRDCGKADLGYWVTGSQPYSVMDIGRATPAEPYTTGTAELNGTRIRVVFDTGAATSYVSLRAAERAGIRIDQPDVIETGLSHGIGSKLIRTWVAPVTAFKIGDEEIRRTRLRIGEFSLPLGDMLIGADFFLSHRIYVASSQHKLYFTYNGGPVFNLNKSPLGTAGATGAAGVASSAPDGTTAGDEHEPAQIAEDPNEPKDAAGFSRRGTAFAARRDFERAIADLTRACELDPGNAAYFYERGQARLHNSQPLLAAADFDQALKLKPDDILSLLSRAELRLAANDKSGAVADLDAAQQAASKEADVRFEIGALLGRAGEFNSAITQYDLWIPAHREDARMADAISNRGWARTLAGEDPAKALADANAAVRLRSHEPRFLARRALAQMKAGHVDKAIADWNAVLAIEPKNAAALYGRGVAKLRTGKTSDGEADIVAAVALEPRVADTARKEGLTP